MSLIILKRAHWGHSNFFAQSGYLIFVNHVWAIIEDIYITHWLIFKVEINTDKHSLLIYLIHFSSINLQKISYLYSWIKSHFAQASPEHLK